MRRIKGAEVALIDNAEIFPRIQSRFEGLRGDERDLW